VMLCVPPDRQTVRSTNNKTRHATWQLKTLHSHRHFTDSDDPQLLSRSPSADTGNEMEINKAGEVRTT